MPASKAVGSIVVTRLQGPRDKLRRYAILVDGRRVGELAEGETRTIDVSPGPHDVRVEIDWAGSHTLAIDVSESTQEKLVCFASAFGLRNMIFNRDLYVTLQRHSDSEPMTPQSVTSFGRTAAFLVMSPFWFLLILGLAHAVAHLSLEASSGLAVGSVLLWTCAVLFLPIRRPSRVR